MLYVLLATVAGLLLFRLGYYIGRQVGETAPVREQILSLRGSARLE